MRQLSNIELTFVSGGCGECKPTPPCHPEHPEHPSKCGDAKGNNGFGNGADANLAAPGNSGSTGGGKAGSVGDARGPR
jgi:hypothetical protein